MMFDLTFQPGPSKISPQVKNDIAEALDLHIPELSHRSKEFSDLSAETIRQIRIFFAVPDDYAVLYVHSATDAMELLIRNLVLETSFHFCNGVFSELFADIAERNGKTAIRDTAAWGMQNDFANAQVPSSAEIVTVSYCETTTGVMCSDTDIAQLRKNHPDPLLCVDVTSMAGMQSLPTADADAWFFSVQKGMGLPSGMGVLIVSPLVLQRASDLRSSGQIHPGLFALPDMGNLCQNYAQTLNTPNILAIHLLGTQLKRWNDAGGIVPLEAFARKKATFVYDFLQESSELACFTDDASAQSYSVICITAAPPLLTQLHTEARQKGILLGTGYGPLQDKTFRLANFPAITEHDMLQALEILVHATRKTLSPLAALGGAACDNLRRNQATWR